MNIVDTGRHLPELLSALLVAILFVQSGLDKVLDWKGNIEWLTGHFSKTFLSGMVPVMVATITILELATGFLAFAGIAYFFLAGTTIFIFYASVVGAGSVIALFFGQRIAKDYAGAAVLVPYFLLLLFVMYITNPYRPVV
ncbi:hypothetical protein BH10ACI2_BH10ACI2_15670 [soil metagenome]